MNTSSLDILHSWLFKFSIHFTSRVLAVSSSRTDVRAQHSQYVCIAVSLLNHCNFLFLIPVAPPFSHMYVYILASINTMPFNPNKTTLPGTMKVTTFVNSQRLCHRKGYSNDMHKTKATRRASDVGILNQKKKRKEKANSQVIYQKISAITLPNVVTHQSAISPQPTFRSIRHLFQGITISNPIRVARSVAPLIIRTLETAIS